MCLHVSSTNARVMGTIRCTVLLMLAVHIAVNFACLSQEFLCHSL